MIPPDDPQALARIIQMLGLQRMQGPQLLQLPPQIGGDLSYSEEATAGMPPMGQAMAPPEMAPAPGPQGDITRAGWQLPEQPVSLPVNMNPSRDDGRDEQRAVALGELGKWFQQMAKLRQQHVKAREQHQSLSTAIKESGLTPAEVKKFLGNMPLFGG